LATKKIYTTLDRIYLPAKEDFEGNFSSKVLIIEDELFNRFFFKEQILIKQDMENVILPQFNSTPERSIKV
jgi:hypothetical protein